LGSAKSRQRSLIKTGIFGLDEIMLGGVISGNVIILEGMPGTGKTTLALEFIYRGAQEFGEPGLIITFETSPEKLKRDAAGFGWDLDKLEEENKVKIVYTSPSVLIEELQTHDGVLSNEIKALGAKRVVIDGLTPLRLFGERLGGRPYRESLHLLIDTLIRFEVTPMLTTETVGTNPIGETGAREEQYLGDTVITLRNQARRRSVHRSIEIAKSRGQDFFTGRHALKIVANAGIHIFPRVYARPKDTFEQPTSSVRHSSGNLALDGMLGGGVLEGSVTLVVGISGTGKTVAGMQFLGEGAKEGGHGLLVSLDEHPAQIARNAGNLNLEFKKQLDKGNIILHYDSPLEVDIDEHFYSIKELVEKNNITRVVIDSVAAYENAQPEEAREFLVALATYFKNKLIPAFFNFECPELLGISQISDHLKSSAIVDNIVLLNYVEISTLIRRAITIPKARQ
jgi:circadian clock protein KaiC